MRGKLSDRLLVSYARDTGFDSQTRNSWYYYKSKKQSFIAPLFSFEELFLFSSSSFLTASHCYVRLGFKTIFLLVCLQLLLLILGYRRRCLILFLVQVRSGLLLLLGFLVIGTESQQMLQGFREWSWVRCLLSQRIFQRIARTLV